MLVAAFTPFFSSSKGRGSGPSNRPYDPSTGIGRGAPGFTTNVAQVRIPADIAARIRAGEEVSADEITRALDDVRAGRYKPKAERERDEWLSSTSSATGASAGGGAGKRKGGRR